MNTRNFKHGVAKIVQDPKATKYPFKLQLTFRDGGRHALLERGYRTLAGAQRGLRSQWVAKVMRQTTPFARFVEFEVAQGKPRKQAEGLAATIGRKVYGQKGMTAKSVQGARRKRR